ncbi:ALF repeat-containing protein [Streptomyces flaveus]|uniref:ALF repeat-containing protein n=1 Tax=Streptomyces flaveus TaxID=66370 RepID=UPI0033288219
MEGAGPGVTQAGQAVLDAGSTEKLREFITTGYYTARTQDERVRAVQLKESGGPEVEAAARVALEGPPQLLHAFIEVGQYKALRQDLLSATHVARVQRLISSAAGATATAQKNAAEALKAAAEARKAAAEAADWAKKADASAKEAGTYAEQARQSAKDAEASAAKAAASAKTARQAEADAHRAARDANNSATRAEASASAAAGSAGEAWQAANAARASAEAAGKDSAAADKAAIEAWIVTAQKLVQEAEEQRRNEEERKATAELQTMEDAFGVAAAEDEADWWDYVSGTGHLILDAGGLVPGFGEVADLLNCGWYGAEGDAVNSTLSCAAAVPFIGWGATAGKWGKSGLGAIEAFAKAQKAQGKVPHIWAANRRYPNAQNAARHWSDHKANSRS